MPYKLEYYIAKTVDECAFAIKDMVVRGAPAIGAAAVYGIVLGKDNLEETARTTFLSREINAIAADLDLAVICINSVVKAGMLVESDELTDEEIKGVG